MMDTTVARGAREPTPDVFTATSAGAPIWDSERAELQPGARIGRYVVLARLGAGGMYAAYYERSLGPDHPDVGVALGNLCEVALLQGRPDEALPLLERAVAIDARHAGPQEFELLHRFTLARALVGVGGDRTRALAEARAAAEGYRAADDSQQLAEVEAFLREHGDTR